MIGKICTDVCLSAHNTQVVGAGVHVGNGIGSGDGVTVGRGVINGQGVTAGQGEGMGTGMFAGSGEGTGMMVGIGSGVGSGHMITVGDGFVEGKGILENYEGHDMFIVSGSGSGTGISVTGDNACSRDSCRKNMATIMLFVVCLVLTGRHPLNQIILLVAWLRRHNAFTLFCMYVPLLRAMV